MNKKKMFYPNRKCLKYVEEAVSELEIIVKYPTRVLERSPFIKYCSVLEKGKCEDFLSVCVKNPDELRRAILYNMVIAMLQSHILEDKIEQVRLRKEKKELYDKCNLLLLEINAQLKEEKAKDRKDLLELSHLLAERIIYELKSDLML